MTATKIFVIKGSKTFVVVHDDAGVEVGRFGGKRAERAGWVLTVDNWQPFTEPLDYVLQPGESDGGYVWDWKTDPCNGRKTGRLVWRRLPGRKPISLRRDDPKDPTAIRIA